MSNYPSWWDSTLTVFNKYTDNTTRVVTWYKTYIPNCFWKHTGDKITVNNTTIDTDSITCRVPQQDNYLDPYQWNELPIDDKLEHFTIKQGDIIVKGMVEDDINEYQSGKRSTDLLTKYRAYDSCMEIKQFTINIMSGMINPHYLIRGK